jgi:hypothetical protein
MAVQVPPDHPDVVAAFKRALAQETAGRYAEAIAEYQVRQRARAAAPAPARWRYGGQKKSVAEQMVPPLKGNSRVLPSFTVAFCAVSRTNLGGL